MAKKIGDLFVQLKLDNKKFRENLNQSAKQSKVTSQQMMRAFGMLTLAIGAVGTALTKIVKDTMRYGLEIDKMAKVTGLTTTEVQKLRYAAEQEHASMQALEKGLMNLTVRLGYAGDGLVSYTRYFDALNIEYRKADGTLRNAYDVFGDIADVVSRGELSTEELAATMQLFGARAAKELIPLLKKGKEWFGKMGDEVDKLGGILDANTIRLIKETDDELTALKTSLRGFKAQLSTQIIPILKTATTAWIDWNKEINETTSNIGGAAWVNTVAIYGKTLAEMAKRNEENIIKLLEMQEAGKGSKEEIRLLQREIELTTITIAKFQKQGLAVVSGGLDIFTDKVKTVIPPVDDLGDAIKEVGDETEETGEKVEMLSGAFLGIGQDLHEMDHAYLDIIDETKDWSEQTRALGNVLGSVLTKGKMDAEALLTSLLRIGISFLPGGGFLKGFLGGLFGEGGIAIEKGWKPIFAQEGMAVAEKPTVSPGGNVYGEKGWEIFMQGEQFTEFIKSMKPTILIHNYTNRDIIVEEIKGTSESAKFELQRELSDNVLSKTEMLNE